MVNNIELQYSTFIDFMELLVRFSSGPEEFYEQVKQQSEAHQRSMSFTPMSFGEGVP